MAYWQQIFWYISIEILSTNEMNLSNKKYISYEDVILKIKNKIN